MRSETTDCNHTLAIGRGNISYSLTSDNPLQHTRMTTPDLSLLDPNAWWAPLSTRCENAPRILFQSVLVFRMRATISLCIVSLTSFIAHLACHTHITPVLLRKSVSAPCPQISSTATYMIERPVLCQNLVISSSS